MIKGMMTVGKKSLKLVCLLILVFSLTGCWDHYELPARGFVLGAAFDQTDDGRLKLTVQIYKPSQSVGGRSDNTGKSYVNITTVDNSFVEAIRDIPVNLGRKAQLSHLRIILIGEKLAKSKGMGDALDSLFRDHEPRLTIAVAITEGEASRYLNAAPLIENTISQQLFEDERSASENSGKAYYMNLLRAAIQMKSEVSDTLIPYVYFNRTQGSPLSNIAGAAVVQEGRMVDQITPTQMESILALLDKYHGGIVQLECGDREDSTADSAPANHLSESVELTKVQTKCKVVPTQQPPKVKVHVDIRAEAAIVGLSCSNIESSESEAKLVKKVEQEMKKQFAGTVKVLQSKRIDVLGIGNEVYRTKPALWKQWKQNWRELFAEAEFDYSVHVQLFSTGTSVGKPSLYKAGE
jgi:spore germination protein KC